MQVCFYLVYYIEKSKGAGATGQQGQLHAPVAQLVRGQHGGKKLPFLEELRFKPSMQLT
jgi:hypothetical protein